MYWVCAKFHLYFTFLRKRSRLIKFNLKWKVLRRYSFVTVQVLYLLIIILFLLLTEICTHTYSPFLPPPFLKNCFCFNLWLRCSFAVAFYVLYMYVHTYMYVCMRAGCLYMRPTFSCHYFAWLLISLLRHINIWCINVKIPVDSRLSAIFRKRRQHSVNHQSHYAPTNNQPFKGAGNFCTAVQPIALPAASIAGAIFFRRRAAGARL